MAKKKTVPLFKIIQGLLVINELTGNNTFDIIENLVDALFTGRQVSIGDVLAVNIKQSLQYIENNPFAAVTQAAFAAVLTSLLAKGMEAAGVPKTVDLGICRVAIR